MDTYLLNKIDFIREIDKLKSIDRMTSLINCSRVENDAEHSFHVALMAIVLQEYANEEVNILKVVKMLLIHDIVEIDAGDTFAYDELAYKSKVEREKVAANRIFSLLDHDMYKEFYGLWQEFEEIKTPESRFANGLDRLQPMLLNYYGGGGTWKSHNVPKEKIFKRLEPLQTICPKLWDFGVKMIEDYFKRV